MTSKDGKKRLDTLAFEIYVEIILSEVDDAEYAAETLKEIIDMVYEEATESEDDDE